MLHPRVTEEQRGGSIPSAQPFLLQAQTAFVAALRVEASGVVLRAPVSRCRPPPQPAACFFCGAASRLAGAEGREGWPSLSREEWHRGSFLPPSTVALFKNLLAFGIFTMFFLAENV